jgi:hypothetical protein
MLNICHLGDLGLQILDVIYAVKINYANKFRPGRGISHGQNTFLTRNKQPYFP